MLSELSKKLPSKPLLPDSPRVSSSSSWDSQLDGGGVFLFCFNRKEQSPQVVLNIM